MRSYSATSSGAAAELCLQGGGGGQCQVRTPGSVLFQGEVLGVSFSCLGRGGGRPAPPPPGTVCLASP